MSTAHRLRELSSLQAVRDMVAQHLAGSIHSTGAVLDVIRRHELKRTGPTPDAAYWHAGSGNVLPLRAGVVAEVARLGGRCAPGAGPG